MTTTLSAEQELLETIPRLSPSDMERTLDFIRALIEKSKTDRDVEERVWDDFFQRNEAAFDAMALQALADAEADELLDIAIEDDIMRPAQ